MRSRRSIVERQPHLEGHAAVVLRYIDPGIGVTVAEGREAVEHVVRPAIPEIAHVERGVDHRRRVAPGAAAHIDATDLKDSVRLLRAFVEARLVGFDEVGVEHALGTDHVVGGIDDRRISIQRIG
ncbi:hypothetical protein D3C87_1279070 [compost metagenome]